MQLDYPQYSRGIRQRLAKAAEKDKWFEKYGIGGWSWWVDETSVSEAWWWVSEWAAGA